jgi:hypothetical protein
MVSAKHDANTGMRSDLCLYGIYPMRGLSALAWTVFRLPPGEGTGMGCLYEKAP